MGNNRAASQYIRLLDVPKHVNSTYKRQNNASGVIKATGEHFYIVHGKEVTPEEFNEIFPIVPPRQNVNQYGDKLDGKQIAKY